MKNVNIAYAGCPPEFVQRLNLAKGLLSSADQTISVEPWRGGEAELLIADQSSSFAQNVARLASHNNIPVLFASGEQCPKEEVCGGCVSYAEPINTLCKKLARYFQERAHNTVLANEAQSAAGLEQVIAQQAPIVAISDEAGTVLLDYQRGLCLGSDPESIHSVIGLLIDNQPIRVSAQASVAGFDTSSQLSIESAFFTQLMAAQRLPEFSAEVTLQLRHWPDIRPDAVADGLALANCCSRLTRETANKTDLLALCEQPELVNALLWATKIARLQQVTSVTPTVQRRTQPSKVSATLSKLIRWLGR